ncbi:hypothetical protein VTK73DRAFT_1660 [Phialemonium thermophilum]|uniref:Uncharacterized protein n=1 Tax=Phialemonium thermophilum TaxID=223376 RepID=A0ABR3VT57_9PEZI
MVGLKGTGVESPRYVLTLPCSVDIDSPPTVCNRHSTHFVHHRKAQVKSTKRDLPRPPCSPFGIVLAIHHELCSSPTLLVSTGLPSCALPLKHKLKVFKVAEEAQSLPTSLPCPAVKFVVGQQFYFSRQPRVWACVQGSGLDSGPTPRQALAVTASDEPRSHITVSGTPEGRLRRPSPNAINSQVLHSRLTTTGRHCACEHPHALGVGHHGTHPRPFRDSYFDCPGRFCQYRIPVRNLAPMAYISGTNPRWGRDERAPPTFGPGGLGTMPAAPAYTYQYYPGMPAPSPFIPFPPAGAGIPTPQPQQTAYSYISGLGGGNRHPQPYPIIDPDMPAANMTNSTGGVGCEPGYNYFFAPEHTKIHVLKSGATPPWQLPAHFSVPFHACHVPVSTTVGELLRGFGANNPIPKKNRVTEVVQGGNGRWYRGVSFSGESTADMNRTLKEIGWDKHRSGLPGKKPVVYLYITKD